MFNYKIKADRQKSENRIWKEVHCLGRMTKELEETMSNVPYTCVELDAACN